MKEGQAQAGAVSAPPDPRANVASEPAVRLEAVRKRFGYRETLRGVSLEVPRGCCFVLAGPNGAGKSTLLRILSTQWTPSSGRVSVLGIDALRRRLEVRAHIGLVLHDTFLRRELTVEENLRLAADLHGLPRPKAEERAERLLERLGIASRRGDPVSTLSQGLAKRTSLARSLLPDPELWVLDEPFASLDPRGQELLESMIADHVAGGRTAILVTHQLAVGRRLAGSSAWIDEGKLLRCGPGAEGLADALASAPREGDAA